MGTWQEGAGVGCRKRKQGTSFPFFILDVKSYLLPHCSTVGVCQGWGGVGGGGVGAEGCWRGAGSLDYESF